MTVIDNETVWLYGKQSQPFQDIGNRSQRSFQDIGNRSQRSRRRIYGNHPRNTLRGPLFPEASRRSASVVNLCIYFA